MIFTKNYIFAQNKIMKKKFRGKYRIESNRWQFWDYSSPGSYFLTILTAYRECYMGHIRNKRMYRSAFGDIVEEEMLKIPTYNKRIHLDKHIVMPNHIHCIITLGGYDYDNGVAGREEEESGGGRTDADALTDSAACTDLAACTDPVKEVHELPLQESTQARTQPAPPLSFPDPSTIRLSGYTPGTKPTEAQIIEYRKLRRRMIIPKIIGKLKMQTSKDINLLRGTEGQRNWHKDYHDHVIRDIHAYHRIYSYIKTNPERWDEDTLR